MKWKKLGKIFDPSSYNLPNNCKEFAQSPQTLVFDDFIRVYFSTREREESGKFLSHIAYVDMDKHLERVIGVSTKPVIPLGELGCFDEHGIFPINVVRNNNDIIAYTCGWSRRTSVSVETSIGFATSSDSGKTFEKLGSGPIVSSTVDEPFLVGDAFVKIYNGVWHMWYIFGTHWIDNEFEESARVYKIAHATSFDGIRWQKEGNQIISDVLNEHECQALPTVIFHAGLYHMYFCYREAIGFRNQPGKGYRLGYAFSSDLKTWTRDDESAGIQLSDQGWDSEMMCYPHVFECDSRIYLLYNGNQFGRAGFGAAILQPE